MRYPPVQMRSPARQMARTAAAIGCLAWGASSAEPARLAATAPTESKRDVTPQGDEHRVRLQGLGRTPEEEKLLDEISRVIDAYETESKEFRREVQQLIEKRYEEKRASLSSSYEKAIRDLEVIERKERLDAIAQFEEFLRRYPDNPTYTPDVMFRLAELYYERSSDEHLLALREYEEKLKATDTSKPENLPPEPPAD